VNDGLRLFVQSPLFVLVSDIFHDMKDPHQMKVRPHHIAALFVAAVSGLHAQTTFTGEVRVNGDTAGIRQIAPQLAIAPDGIVYVLWTDFRAGVEGQVYLTSSGDGGASFRAAWPLTNAEGVQAGMQRGAQFVIDRMGMLHLTWQERNSLGKISARYARSTDGGVTFSEPLAVAGDSGQQNQDFPSIAVDSSGNPFLCWIDDRETATTRHTQLYFTRSTDGGATFSAPVRASIMPGGNGGSCECCNTSIAVSSDGNVFISFRGNIDNDRDIYIARSLDGGATFATYKAASESWNIPACPMTGSSICIDPMQTAHVVWRDSRPSSAGRDYIYYTSLRRTDDACPPDQRISDSPKKSNYPTITITPDGALICAYQDNRIDQADVFYTTSVDGGITFSPGRKLSRESNASKQELPILRIAPSGSRYIVWQDNRRDEGDIVLSKDTTRLGPVSSVDDESRSRSDDGVSLDLDRTGTRLTISACAGQASETLSIHSILGRQVMRCDLDASITTIDVSALPQGRYLVRVWGRVMPVVIVR